MRFAIPAITAMILLTLPLHAGDDGLTGNWKLSIYDAGQQNSFWILQIASKDGKLKITATPLKGLPEVEVKEVKLSGDSFSFAMTGHLVRGKEKVPLHFDFEGKLPKPGAKKILGSLTFDNSTGVAFLEATTAKNQFELDRDVVTRTPTDPRAMNALFELLDAAAANKADIKEVNEWINIMLKASDQFGPRLASAFQLRLLDHLIERPAYSKIAVEIASKSAKSFQVDPARALNPQLQLVTQLDYILRNSDQKKEAEALALRLEKLEVLAYAEHAKMPLDFDVAKYKRKTKSSRAVLVELFTGAQCPPCVAADMAFDGLAKAYSPADVVLLQYHVHIPRPDPLNGPDTEARLDFYGEAKKVRSAPTCLFNGKVVIDRGGAADDAADKYKEYGDIINKLFEMPEVVQLGASAVRTGDKIAIKAEVKDLTSASDKLRLRFALVEDWARYRGANGVQYHHRVVRAMPGGPRGFALKAKNSEHAVDVDLEKERKRINKFLDEAYPEGLRPMRMRELHLVAFVQDDDSLEVLHAIDVPVTEKK